MGSVFSIMSGIVLYQSLLIGTIGKLPLMKRTFILMFVGVNITFFPQFIIGLNGLSRKYVD